MGRRLEEYEHGGVRLAFERAGSVGDPLVLVHGAWDDHHVWDRVAGGLSEGFQLLRYDRRHHGASFGPEARSPVGADASDLAELLIATDLYPAHVAGHGYGGLVAFRLAADRPELVRSIAAHEPPALGLEASTAGGPAVGGELEESARAAARGQGEAALAAFVQRFAAQGEVGPPPRGPAPPPLADRARRWASEMADPMVTGAPDAVLPGHPVPLLATAGERSAPAARRLSEAVATAVPNGTFRLLRGTGHWAPWSDPDLYAGVLGGFLLERDVPST